MGSAFSTPCPAPFSTSVFFPKNVAKLIEAHFDLLEIARKISPLRPPFLMETTRRDCGAHFASRHQMRHACHTPPTRCFIQKLWAGTDSSANWLILQYKLKLVDHNKTFFCTQKSRRKKNSFSRNTRPFSVCPLFPFDDVADDFKVDTSLCSLSFPKDLFLPNDFRPLFAFHWGKCVNLLVNPYTPLPLLAEFLNFRNGRNQKDRPLSLLPLSFWIPVSYGPCFDHLPEEPPMLPLFRSLTAEVFQVVAEGGVGGFEKAINTKVKRRPK